MHPRSLRRRARRILGRRTGKPFRSELARRVDRAVADKRWDAPVVEAVVAQFHRIYYAASQRTWKNTYWRGVRVLKSPLDLWVYQEILSELRPDVIVEAGTMHGGSAFYLASICDLLDHGKIVTIDIRRRPGRPDHPRITYLTGSSADPAVASQVDELIGDSQTVMVILDSNHSREHVLKELDLWRSRVSVGSYLVVEDTHVNGRPVLEKFGPGPWEAVAEWLPANRNFRRDRAREKFFFTFNRRGYLRRTA